MTAVLAAIHAVPAGAAVRRHLYQLRSALRDEESPLAAYMPGGACPCRMKSSSTAC